MTPRATFAGGGYDGTTNTYTYTTADSSTLVINGENFRGVNSIQFGDTGGNVYITKAVNPAAPPAGLTFNAEGTQITVSPSFINANNATWLDSGGAENLTRSKIFLDYGVNFPRS